MHFGIGRNKSIWPFCPSLGEWAFRTGGIRPGQHPSAGGYCFRWLCRGKDDDRVGVERFCPVRIAPDEVFSLAAQGHNAQSHHRSHIHRGLRGFRHRQHIAANDLRQCVHGKRGKVIFIKGDGRVPDYGAGTVVSIRWDIPGLLADFGIEPLFSCPDASNSLSSRGGEHCSAAWRKRTFASGVCRTV